MNRTPNPPGPDMPPFLGRGKRENDSCFQKSRPGADTAALGFSAHRVHGNTGASSSISFSHETFGASQK